MSPGAAHTVRRLVDPVATTALADLLGAGDVDLSPGAAVPLLWHWVALARWPSPELLGPDGHPRPGSGVVPEVPLPRRMFGGGTVHAHAPLRLGEEVVVSTTAGSPRERTGRSGPLVLVDLAVEVHDLDGRVILEETQHLVYGAARPRPDAAASPAPDPAPLVPRLLEVGQEGWRLRTDPPHLARFSALTANPHRIHIDWPYATRAEGYPGLVVQGPLLTIALAEVDRRAGAARRRLRHRGLAPLFCGTDATLVRNPGTEPRTDPGAAVVEAWTRPHADQPPVVHARVELDPDD